MRLTAFLSCRLIVVASAMLLVAVQAWADDEPNDRATLKGITEVRVVVEGMHPEVEPDGLTKAQLQTDVELRLRQSGIKVAPSSSAYLYVSIQALQAKDRSFYSYSLITGRCF